MHPRLCVCQKFLIYSPPIRINYMGLHKNSQKRYYYDHAVYFITTKTYLNYRYFNEDIFCELLIDEINLCQKIHGCRTFAYKINPDHLHILLQPNKTSNISILMHFIKRNFSQNINKILYPALFEGEDAHPRLQIGLPSPLSYFDEKTCNYFQRFNIKYGTDHQLPKFQWQSSFHDHIIRDNYDFYVHIAYIKRQWIKHELHEDKWCHIDPRYNFPWL